MGFPPFSEFRSGRTVALNPVFIPRKNKHDVQRKGGQSSSRVLARGPTRSLFVWTPQELHVGGKHPTLAPAQCGTSGQLLCCCLEEGRRRRRGRRGRHSIRGSLSEAQARAAVAVVVDSALAVTNVPLLAVFDSKQREGGREATEGGGRRSGFVREWSTSSNST